MGIARRMRRGAGRAGAIALMTALPGVSTSAATAAQALSPPPVPAQPAPPAATRQTESDEYTSYELLAPDSHQFRILFDVTATTAGARFYFNPIRKGSEASDERVIDLATGQALPFEVVSGAAARASGHPTAALDTDYIKVTLARPVPTGGEQRLRIDKTYQDAKSYSRDGEAIVFARSLGITRNKVVLPPGYALLGCNVPSQVLTEADGRVAVSFMNLNPDAVSLVVRARPVAWAPTTPPTPAAERSGAPPAAPAPPAGTPPPSPASASLLSTSATARIGERAFQDREIVYFLQPPDTHAFDLYHDYTETREGMDRYLNVVRAGSTVSNPSAISLDTGERLTVETLMGEAITKAGIDIGEPVGATSEVVVIRYPPVKKGQSVRLRISETYTDPNRYGLVGDTLVWRRSFGRPRNAVVLPVGWMVTASSIPARISQTDDGRTRLDLDNARPDDIDVLIRARRARAVR